MGEGDDSSGGPVTPLVMTRVYTHTHIIVIVVIVIAWPPSAPSPTRETPTKKHFAGALRFCLF